MMEYYSKYLASVQSYVNRLGSAMDTLRMLIQISFLLSFLFSLGYHSFLPQFSYIFLLLSRFFFLFLGRLKGPATRFPHHKIPPYSFLYLHSFSFFYWCPGGSPLSAEETLHPSPNYLAIRFLIPILFIVSFRSLSPFFHLSFFLLRQLSGKIGSGCR